LSWQPYLGRSTSAQRFSESVRRKCLTEMKTSLQQLSSQQTPQTAMLAIDGTYQSDGARMLLKARRTASMREHRMERVWMMPLCSLRARTPGNDGRKNSVYMQNIRREEYRLHHLVVYTCSTICDAPLHASRRQVCVATTQCRGM
jgi:hypothetical protein